MATQETTKPSLFQYAVLFHPKATKEQIERGERPKSIVLTEPTTKLAGSEQEIAILAARSVPADYTDKLEDVEIVVRPF